MFFALMIFASAVLGADHDRNVMRAIVIMIAFIYSLLRYIFNKGFYISNLIPIEMVIWIVCFFCLYFLYGNLYYNNLNLFGGNDTAAVLLLFVIASMLFIGNQRENYMWVYMRNVYLLTLILYLGYMFWVFSNVSLIELAGFYRLGDAVQGEYFLKGNSNDVAISVSVLMAPILYELLCNKKRLYLFPSIISVPVVLFTGSKSGVIILFLYVIAFWCIGRATNLKKIFMGFLLFLSFFILITTNDTLNTIIGQRLLDFIDFFVFNDGSVYSDSTEVRSSMYKIGVDLWLEAPILGGGLGSFQEFSGIDAYSHNTYIELMTSFGLLGLCLYYSYPFYTMFLLFYRNVARVNLFVISVIIISLFIDCVGVRFYDYISWVNNIFILSYAQIVLRKRIQLIKMKI